MRTRNNTYWQFEQITGHQSPSNKDDRKHKGCSFNVTVEWEDGSITHEPHNIVSHNAPEICSEYRQKHNLLNEPGWKWFHHIHQIEKETSMYDICRHSKILL